MTPLSMTAFKAGPLPFWLFLLSINNKNLRSHTFAKDYLAFPFRIETFLQLSIPSTGCPKKFGTSPCSSIPLTCFFQPES